MEPVNDAQRRNSAFDETYAVFNCMPAAGVEFRNEKILEGIPLDKGTVQVMDPLTYPQ